jgi:hypothetical protein
MPAVGAFLSYGKKAARKRAARHFLSCAAQFCGEGMKSEFVTENEGIEEVDPFLGVKVKTSWYPAARGWFRGR